MTVSFHGLYNAIFFVLSHEHFDWRRAQEKCFFLFQRNVKCAIVRDIIVSRMTSSKEKVSSEHKGDSLQWDITAPWAVAQVKPWQKINCILEKMATGRCSRWHRFVLKACGRVLKCKINIIQYRNPDGKVNSMKVRGHKVTGLQQWHKSMEGKQHRVEDRYRVHYEYYSYMTKGCFGVLSPNYRLHQKGTF